MLDIKPGFHTGHRLLLADSLKDTSVLVKILLAEVEGFYVCCEAPWVGANTSSSEGFSLLCFTAVHPGQPKEVSIRLNITPLSLC